MLSARQPAPTALLAVRPRTAGRQGRLESTGKDVWYSVGVLALIAVPLPYLVRADHDHYITALLLTLTLAACSFYSQRGAITAALVFLAVLGDYRRYAGYFQGYPLTDPLLLVAPALAMLLLAQALLRGRRAPRTVLAWLVAALMSLMVIEIFNPAQGGLPVGIAGALFYLAPLLWFWVARSFASREFATHFTWTVIAVGTVAMLLGLYQTYLGLLPFEQRWVEQGGYSSLYISDEVVRAFAFFNSSAEYQRYLIVSTMAVFAVWLVARSTAIVLLPLFLLTIFLSGARGPVVVLPLAMALIWAISGQRVAAWLPRLALAAGIAAASLLAILLVLQTSTLTGRVAPLVERQVGGLLDPTNQEKSTATGHVQMLTDGILAGLTTPAGIGLGATTEAAHKFGARNLSSEVDLSNLMISVGLLGGVLYLAIVTAVLAKTVRWWRIERTAHALAIVGSVFGTLSGWLIGGEYSVAALIWFQIGLMDRLSAGVDTRRRSRAHAPGIDHS
jgi:hypothetical protein